MNWVLSVKRISCFVYFHLTVIPFPFSNTKHHQCSCRLCKQVWKQVEGKGKRFDWLRQIESRRADWSVRLNALFVPQFKSFNWTIKSTFDEYSSEFENHLELFRLFKIFICIRNLCNLVEWETKWVRNGLKRTRWKFRKSFSIRPQGPTSDLNEDVFSER